jgi:hypothetical protein|tara:strand:+ start:2081 stop:2227 length:147 start_codon:yes stop_codon:yes gene_type:complete
MENPKSNVINFKKKVDEKFKEENEVILTLDDDENTEFVFEMEIEDETL